MEKSVYTHPREYLCFWPLLVAVAGSIVSGIITNRAQKKAQRKQNEANKELAKYQYEQEQLQIDKQNEYNSPKNQMQRFSDANLNPNLIYGQGSAGGGNQASTPSYTPPNVGQVFSPMQIPNILGMYQTFQMNQAEIEQVRANTDRTKAQTETEAMRPSSEKLRQMVMDLTGKHQEFDLDTKQMLRPYQAQSAELDVRNKQFKLDAGMQQLKNMKQDELIKLLVRQEKETNLRTVLPLEAEERAAKIIFQKYQNQWAKEGVTSSDNPLLRILVRMMGAAGLSPTSWMNSR